MLVYNIEMNLLSQSCVDVSHTDTLIIYVCMCASKYKHMHVTKWHCAPLCSVQG